MINFDDVHIIYTEMQYSGYCNMITKRIRFYINSVIHTRLVKGRNLTQSYSTIVNSFNIQ